MHRDVVLALEEVELLGLEAEEPEDAVQLLLLEPQVALERVELDGDAADLVLERADLGLDRPDLGAQPRLLGLRAARSSAAATAAGPPSRGVPSDAGSREEREEEAEGEPTSHGVWFGTGKSSLPGEKLLDFSVS